MNKRPNASWILIATLTIVVFSLDMPLFAQSAKILKPAKVFILAGQSNMQGQAVIDLDHEKYYNGGRGILNNVMKRPESKKTYAHLKNEQGEFVVRKDVLIRYKTKSQTKKGGLSIGFAGYDGKHHFGPELQFGHLVGDHFEEPVLLIKTAWGGKSLHKDFRPPSAGGTTGEFYKKMIHEVREALEKAPKEFENLKGRELEISGFVWFQGWNDMFDEKGNREYEENLVHLIHDIRSEFEAPNLPVVVGELGNGGEKCSKAMQNIREAQRKAVQRKEVGGHALFVETHSFARPAKDSPNVGHGHHWFGNAESYFLIGDALGKAMIQLHK